MSSEQGDQTSLKTVARWPSLSECFCCNCLKVLHPEQLQDGDGSASQEASARTLDKPCIIPSHWDWETASSPRTWSFLNFFKVPQRFQHPQTTGISLENTMPTFPRNKVFWLSVGYGCLSLCGVGYKLLVMVWKKAEQRRLDLGMSF